MGKRYLLDTNTLIDFSANRLPAKPHLWVADIIDQEPIISIVTKIELLGFSQVPPQIILFTEHAAIIWLDEDIANQTIELRKKYRLKLPDAIIAATALVHDLTIVTRNTADFKSIEKLEVKNHWEFS